MIDKPSSSPNCSFCHTPIFPGQSTVNCPTCRNPYHKECWHDNNNQCAVLGCPGYTDGSSGGDGNGGGNGSNPLQWLILIAVIIMLVWFFGSSKGNSQPVTVVPNQNTLAPTYTPFPTQKPTNTDLPLPTITDEPLPTQPQPTIEIPAPTAPSSGLQPIPDSYDCPDKKIIELQIGAVGKVMNYDVSLREQPVVPAVWDQNIIRRLRADEHVSVIGGPECAYDGTWWKVNTESSVIGWVREYLPSKGHLIKRIN